MELIYKTGDIFKSKAELLVNPVNTVGVMGAGLAAKFKSKYPKNFKAYKAHCDQVDKFNDYKFYAFEENGKTIFNFASKEDFKKSSRLSYIRRSLIYLVSYIERNRITYIAIPPVGCGLGGLEDAQVHHLVLYFLRQIPFEIKVELYGFKIRPIVREQVCQWYDLDYRNCDMFTGVGSRELTREGRLTLYDVANALTDDGYSLSTGDAVGTDEAFWEQSIKGRRVRYGPFGKTYHLPETTVIPNSTTTYIRATKIAALCHPSYRWLPDWMKELHTRNVFQVLGSHLDSPREFLVCWTPDGAQTTRETNKKTGGTGTAIRIADMFGIPVFNLKRKDAVDKLSEFLGINIKRVYSQHNDLTRSIQDISK